MILNYWITFLLFSGTYCGIKNSLKEQDNYMKVVKILDAIICTVTAIFFIQAYQAH